MNTANLETMLSKMNDKILSKFERQLAIAQDKNALSDCLEKLADSTKNKEVLAAIACNPNTPPEVLVELAGEHLTEINNNPALELIFLEYPVFVKDIYYRHFHYKSYSHQTILPDWFIKIGHSYSDWSIRSFIASWQKTPVFYLTKLAKDSDFVVRFSVTDNPNTPIFVLKELTSDYHQAVRDNATKRLSKFFC